jgi:hypothetical protein
MSLDPRTIAREPRDTVVVRDRRTGAVRPHGDRPAADRPLPERLWAGGTTGNERLTTATGIVLLVLLAMIGVTLLRLSSLLWVHLFVGMLLIGPIALKLASTGYRFVRYYTGDPSYRRKGPPPKVLRMIAPIMALSTVIVFVSGVLLLLIGPSSRGALLPIHKVSFIAWVAFTSLHVLGHLPEVAAAVGLDAETVSRVDVLAAVGACEGGELSAWQGPGAAVAARAGRAGRALSLAGALAGGTVLAVAVIPQFGPWLNATTLLHNH